MEFYIEDGVLKGFNFNEYYGGEVPDSAYGLYNGAYGTPDTPQYLEIPKGVKKIGNNAFSDWGNLRSIGFSSGVESIGDRAFYRCGFSDFVRIPNGVTSIGEEAFAGCEDLRMIELPSSLVSIGKYAFANCTSLENVRMNGVKNIGDGAFSNCKRLKKIKLPYGTETIGYEAFEGCINLSEIDIPTTVIDVGSRAFTGTKWLEKHNNDEFVVLGSVLLRYQGNSSCVNIPLNIKCIAENAFKGNSIQEIGIGPNVNSIGAGAFSESFELEEIHLPLVKYIGEFAFWRCENLKTVKIGGYFTNVGKEAFSDCPHLVDVTLSSNVKSIGEGAFHFCGFEHFVVPEGVETIEDRAFRECRNLKYITIPNSVIKIGEEVFKSCNDVTIKASKNSTAVEYAKKNGLKYEEI